MLFDGTLEVVQRQVGETIKNMDKKFSSNGEEELKANTDTSIQINLCF